MELYSRYVELLTRMAQHPGSRDYARARAQELGADPSGLFPGIYQAVRDQLKAGPVQSMASDSPSPEKLL